MSPAGESQAASLMPAINTGGRTATAPMSAGVAFGGCTSADIDRARDPVTRKGRGATTAMAAAAPAYQPAFTSIFFCCFCASAVFGKVSVSTPLAKSALILSRSMPSGSEKLRWKAP
jgi:hypothetical protein